MVASHYIIYTNSSPNIIHHYPISQTERTNLAAITEERIRRTLLKRVISTLKFFRTLKKELPIAWNILANMKQ